MDGRITDVHPSVTQYGYDPQELIGRPVLEACVSSPNSNDLLAGLKTSGVIRNCEVKIKTKEGKLISASLDARVVLDGQGEPIAVEGAVREIPETEEESKRRERDEAAHHMLRVLTRDIYNPLTVILENLTLMKTEEASPSMRQSLGDIERCVHQIKFVMDELEQADLSNPTPITGLPDIAHDVEKRKLEETLKSSVITDPLTRTYNRVFFDQLLEKELVRSKRYNRTVSIMHVVVERLKEISERYGRAVGNQLLTESARILASSIRTSDTLARCGASDFLILLPETDEASSKYVVQRIEEKVKQFNESVFLPPLQLGVRCVFCTGTEDAQKSLGALLQSTS